MSTLPSAAPFTPPSSNKPPIPPWTPPPPTTENLDWASLHTIDLSLLSSPDPAVVAALVARTKQAIQEDGFLYLVNYGVSLDQLHRQFGIAEFLHREISEGDKGRLLWDPASGLFAGWKRAQGWKREAGEYDGIEQFNFYAAEFADPVNRVPECVLPFMDEIAAFADYLSNSVNYRLLHLLSLVLELPPTHLWDHIQSHSPPIGDGYLRHALFHPLPAADAARRQNVRMHGHTDYGTTTLLFSVPVTALHIWSKERKWQPVMYEPGALVVNIGEALEIISGGHFKATTHKVTDVPADQTHLERLSIVQFNAPRGDLRLAPALDSPLLRREGFVEQQGVFREYKRLMDAGVPVPTAKQWREVQVSTRVQVAPEEKRGGVKELDGVRYGEDEFLGVRVVLPV